jgi:16S rRNA (guanine1207-N2)-methyltransferase
LLGSRQSLGRLLIFSYDFATHHRLQLRARAAGIDPARLVWGAVCPPANQPHDAAVLFLPKSRALLEMTLAMVAPTLAVGASLYLVGENQAGIKSAAPLLARLLGPVKTVEAARHCVLLQAIRQVEPPPFDLEQWLVRYTIQAGQGELVVVSLPGVFSHGRLDEGSALLLATLNDQPGDTLLDFGCGAGVIGARLQTQWPALQVDLVDASALALEATRRTWLANGLTPRRIIPSDFFADVTARYAMIVSNPPFHTGVETNYDLVRTFVQGVHGQLQPGGVLQMVTQRSLKIQPLIETTIGPCQVVAQTRQYTVYRAQSRRL